MRKQIKRQKRDPHDHHHHAPDLTRCGRGRDFVTSRTPRRRISRQDLIERQEKEIVYTLRFF